MEAVDHLKVTDREVVYEDDNVVFKGRYNGREVSIKYIVLQERLDLSMEFIVTGLAREIIPTAEPIFFQQFAKGAVTIKTSAREHQPIACICNEWIVGEKLSTLLFKKIYVDKRQIAIDIIDYVGRLKEKGIVHGDLHSSNVLIRTDGSPVIIDYGRAELGDDLSGRDIRGVIRILSGLYYGGSEWRLGAVPDPVFEQGRSLEYCRKKVDELLPV